MNDASASSQRPVSERELAAFVAARTATIELPTAVITVRPATPHDREHLLEGLRHLGQRSLYLRFLRPMPHLTEAEIDHLLAVDQYDHMAWAAFSEEGEPIGIARYMRDPTRPEYAEAAVTVIDEFQRRGVGSALVQLLADTAEQNGIRYFVALVGHENRVLADAMTRAGARVAEQDDFATTFEVRLPIDRAFEDSVLKATLKAVANPDQD